MSTTIARTHVDELEELRGGARFHALLRASAAIVWIASPEGEFVERQPIWEEYTGQTWEEYQGSRWIAAIHPDDRDQVMAEWMGAVGSGSQIHRTQGRIWSARHQAWRAFQTWAVPVRSADGRIVEWLDALTDVHDALEAQEKLLERERELAESRSTANRVRDQLRRLLDASIIGLITTREDEIVDVNDAFLRMLGLTREEFQRTGLNWRCLTPPGHEPVDETALAQLRRTGECQPFEKEYMRHDGTLIPVLVGAAAFNREPLECVCFVADITLRKQAEAAAQHARAAAERANAEKTRVLAAASHDLRQPLQALAALLTLLGSRPLPPEHASLVARADRAIRSLAELLNVLLDFSQLDAGLIQPHVQDFPVERLLDTMRDEFETLAGERGLRFRVGPCDSWIRSDPALLARIIRNLVSNAMKYTPAGGEVRIDCRGAGEAIAIEVADTGIGIPQEMHEAIFEDFRQLDNPERDFGKGLGLGLAIVARMAGLLGHDVGVRSTPGEGSVFTVTVPIVTARPPEIAAASQPARGQRVLFVDDNELVAEVMAELLSDGGHSVTCVTSAEQAIAAVAQAQEAFDAVISDFRLPSLSGLDVIEAVRERWPRANAILLTGDTFDPMLHGLSAVGIKLLRKPVGSDELLGALSGAGSGHG